MAARDHLHGLAFLARAALTPPRSPQRLAALQAAYHLARSATTSCGYELRSEFDRIAATPPTTEQRRKPGGRIR